MFIDTHTHLNSEQFAGNYQEIIGGLQKNNVEAVICVGYDRDSSDRAFEMAQRNKSVYCSLGVHPHDAISVKDDDYQRFTDLASNKKVVAIGEIGLDYHYNFSPTNVQRRVFAEQLKLARECGLPVIIHMREATEDMLEILKENKRCLSKGGVLHCFSGSVETAKQFIDMGLLISFGGAITYKNAVKAIDTISQIPLKHILLETDCPYMSPEPFRGETNEPKYIRFVAEKIARIKNISTEEVAAITKNNTLELFKKMKLKKAMP